jgi:hypothetical protein
MESKMSNSARSLFVFGIYMLVLGPTLVLVPNLMLSLFHVANTEEVWLRVAGMLVIFLGIYDVVAARAELRILILWTIPVRLSVIVFFAAFVIAGLAPPILLLFGAVDFAGAAWTWIEYRREASAKPGRA